jgi:transglutaminase-like putative cysteine protease
MTILDEPTEEVLVAAPDDARQEVQPDPSPPPVDDDEEPRPEVRDLLRPVLAAGLAASAAGLVTGGIFGSWGARITGFVAAFAGAAYVIAVLRSRRPGLLQVAFPFVAVGVGVAGLVLRGESPGDLPTLVADAIDSGRLFRPPVPFDPGWTVILVLLMGCIGYGAAWVAAALDRSRLAIAVPLPVVALTAITQPDDGQFIAGICAFLPILAALAVLFGGDASQAKQLGGEFELKRALRSGLAAIPVILLLVAASKASFLFPEPVIDPTDQPQKPKPVPLSASQDRVLFEVESIDGFTGPWRTGVLDVYDDDAWKLPPFDKSRFEDIAADGQIGDIRADEEQREVTITLRDLGDGAVLPTLGGTTSVIGDMGDIKLDPRTQLIRVPEGRAPKDFTYAIRLPDYPTDDQLEAAPAYGGGLEEHLDAPPPPQNVRRLLSEVGGNPWQRLDKLRSTLLENVVAAGQGTPVDITPERVGELLEEGSKGTPFEIAAAEALLARWAGIPSRVGFGFDGLNDEDGVLTVRPKNAAQWLEVWFESYGWVVLVGAPAQAQTDLETDPNQRFDPNVVASDDVAVEIFLAFEIDDLTQLYERIRDQIIRWLPLVLGLAAAWVMWPAFAKVHRRAKRRRWAEGIGPRAQVAVEYADLRDYATDLNIADIYSTPLEYLYEVKDDVEHAELSWLVARSLYGDLKETVAIEQVRDAEAMAASLRRRLRQAQPVLSQLGAMISRASITQPYSPEVPNIRVPRAPKLRVPSRRRKKKRKGPKMRRKAR